jgi:hypothetical protein
MAERRYMVGSRAPGPSGVWPLRTVFVSLKCHLASYVQRWTISCYLVLQGHFVIFCEILRVRANSTTRLEIPQPTENCGPYWFTLRLKYMKLTFFNFKSHARLTRAVEEPVLQHVCRTGPSQGIKPCISTELYYHPHHKLRPLSFRYTQWGLLHLKSLVSLGLLLNLLQKSIATQHHPDKEKAISFLQHRPIWISSRDTEVSRSWAWESSYPFPPPQSLVSRLRRRKKLETRPYGSSGSRSQAHVVIRSLTAMKKNDFGQLVKWGPGLKQSRCGIKMDRQKQ